MYKFMRTIFGRQQLEDKLLDYLRQAEMLLLKSEDGYEYSKAMVVYHGTRVKQLRSSLATLRRST